MKGNWVYHNYNDLHGMSTEEKKTWGDVCRISTGSLTITKQNQLHTMAGTNTGFFLLGRGNGRGNGMHKQHALASFAISARSYHQKNFSFKVLFRTGALPQGSVHTSVVTT